MTAVRDAAATRGRILAAATAEFSAYGIAGARIDRIALQAQANKAMIYRYFGSKDELFDAVFSAHVAEFIDAVSFDAADLPGYAGRLFDQYERQPRTLRLTHWYQLERPHGAALRILVEGNRRKIAALAAAQACGELDDRYAPVELLALVRGIAMAWHNLTPELRRSISRSRARRREVVVDAVRHLTET